MSRFSLLQRPRTSGCRSAPGRLTGGRSRSILQSPWLRAGGPASAHRSCPGSPRRPRSRRSALVRPAVPGRGRMGAGRRDRRRSRPGRPRFSAHSGLRSASRRHPGRCGLHPRAACSAAGLSAPRAPPEVAAAAATSSGVHCPPCPRAASDPPPRPGLPCARPPDRRLRVRARARAPPEVRAPGKGRPPGPGRGKTPRRPRAGTAPPVTGSAARGRGLSHGAEAAGMRPHVPASAPPPCLPVTGTFGPGGGTSRWCARSGDVSPGATSRSSAPPRSCPVSPSWRPPFCCGEDRPRR